jgi:hypothetical protein
MSNGFYAVYEGEKVNNEGETTKVSWGFQVDHVNDPTRDGSLGYTLYAGRGSEYFGNWFDQPTLFVRYYNIPHLLGDEEVDIPGLGRVSCFKAQRGPKGFSATQKTLWYENRTSLLVKMEVHTLDNAKIYSCLLSEFSPLLIQAHASGFPAKADKPTDTNAERPLPSVPAGKEGQKTPPEQQRALIAVYEKWTTEDLQEGLLHEHREFAAVLITAELKKRELSPVVPSKPASTTIQAQQDTKSELEEIHGGRSPLRNVLEIICWPIVWGGAAILTVPRVGGAMPELLNFGVIGWGALMATCGLFWAISNVLPEKNFLGRMLAIISWPIAGVWFGIATGLFTNRGLADNLKPSILVWAITMGVVFLLQEIISQLPERGAIQRTLAAILYGFLFAAAAAFFGVFLFEATSIENLIIFLVIGGIGGAVLGFFKP